MRESRSLGAARDAVRAQLWPLPTLGVLAGAVAGIALPSLDRSLDGSLSSGLADYLFGGGAGAARTLLDAIASSLITVTSLTFSLTVVTLQLAGSQYSPRLLRTFTRDRVVHATLAVFLATFTYALTVLRAVRAQGEGGAEFVPRISVTAAYLLALVSVIALVLFLAHLANEIRVESILHRVSEDATATIARTLPRSVDEAVAVRLPVPPPDAARLVARSSGFITRIDEQALLAATTETDTIVLLEHRVGSFMVESTPTAAAWSRTGGPPSEADLGRLEDALEAAITTGKERTGAEDAGFGLRQLTDVAIKALSPGINDPTTAVHALGHISAVLCALATRDLQPRTAHDDRGVLRVAGAPLGLAELVDAGLEQPRRYGARDPVVLARIAVLLGELDWCLRLPEHRSIVPDQLDRLRRTVTAQDFDSAQREHLTGLIERVLSDVERRRRSGEAGAR